MSSNYPPVPVLPNRFHGSTTFNSQIKSYDHLAQRIRRMLGEPLIQVEVSSEQIYEYIDVAIEYFTKFAGMDEEFLIFRSDLYVSGQGLPIGRLINISPEFLNSANPDDKTVSASLSAGYDWDLDSYRKVVDVYSYGEGNNTGVNTLFTIENTIAQQAYFGQLLGNVGYDLVTWQALKTWLDTREKVLALTPYIRFNPDTQMLKIIPEPAQSSGGSTYYGLVGCKVQKPLKYLVSQLWVYRYSLALTKIAVGHVRGKFGGQNLFGGQTVNADVLLRQGEKEKDELEKEITTDQIDRDPIRFFIGLFMGMLAISQFFIS